jgi:hypothetical protein
VLRPRTAPEKVDLNWPSIEGLNCVSNARVEL